MDPRNVIVWTLLVVLAVLAMSAGVQAQELREVPASEILEQIQAGEDVYLENVRITGEFNVGKIELETMLVERKFVKRVGLEEIEIVRSEELKIVGSEMVIINSIFENNVDFSKTQFKKTLDFRLTSFLNISDFTNANFSGDADFWGANFSGDADFWGADFGGYTKFAGAKFGGDADFEDADFYDDTNFKYVVFGGDAYFKDADFYANADFRTANFSGNASFFSADFYANADFQTAKFGGDADFKHMDFRRDIFFDNQVYIKLIKDFRDNALFDDANNIYYQYRKRESQASLANFFMWASCGYGVRPWYAVVWGVTIIFMCALVYWLKGGIRQSKENCEDDEQDAPLCDAFYFIMVAVTTVGFMYLSRDCGWELQYAIILAVAMILIYIQSQYKLRFFCWQNQTDTTYKQGRKSLLTLYFRCLKKLNMWLRGVCRLENNGDKKDTPFCDAFYFIMVAVTTVGFMYLSRDCGWKLQDTRILTGAIILIFILIYIRKCRLESNIDKKDASFCDAFYYSVTTFTTLSYGDWYPKNYYRILASIEGLLGWLILALFLVTLANVMIRP